MSGLEWHTPAMVAALALEWMTQDPRPRILLGNELKLLWANSAADGVFRIRRDLEIRDGALSAVNQAYQEDLAAFVRGAGPETTSFALRSDESDGHLIFRAQRIGIGSPAEHVGVQFHGTDLGGFQLADFRRIFGFTPAEHQVLLHLLEGRTADEVAVEKQVSVNTIRYQIRQIYDKVGVCSREGLFRRIRPYIIP